MTITSSQCLCGYFHEALACVASVSVWFRSKERGTRVKDRAKKGETKRKRLLRRLMRVKMAAFRGAYDITHQTMETLYTIQLSLRFKLMEYC